MDFLKVAVIIAFVLATILTIKIRPEIHQPMLIEDANFKLVRISDTITTENIPVVSSQTSEKAIEIKTGETNSKEAIEIPKANQVEPSQNKTINITQTLNPKQQIIIPKSTSNDKKEEIDTSQLELLKEIMKAAQELDQPEVVEKQVSTPQPKPKTVEPKPQVSYKNEKSNTNPYMTEQEELIAWSKWRSDIHNKVMRDSNAGSAPFGTLFTFSFLVDKYGNVSNVKVECSNNYCMNIAKNNLKPAIQNLQRKPILNFPKGTQRSSVVVTGSFLIGTEDRFSTPSNFSDIERVVH